MNLQLPTPVPADPSEVSKGRQARKLERWGSVPVRATSLLSASPEVPVRDSIIETPLRMCTGEPCPAGPGWLGGESLRPSQPHQTQRHTQAEEQHTQDILTDARTLPQAPRRMHRHRNTPRAVTPRCLPSRRALQSRPELCGSLELVGEGGYRLLQSGQALGAAPAARSGQPPL